MKTPVRKSITTCGDVGTLRASLDHLPQATRRHTEESIKWLEFSIGFEKENLNRKTAIGLMVSKKRRLEVHLKKLKN